MKKLIKIEGMMCSHCEARVKKALEAIAGVASAQVSHVSGTAQVEMQGVTDQALADAVSAQDYTVLEISEV